MKIYRILMIATVMLIVVGCNKPPLYQTHARVYLVQQKVDDNVIKKLLAIKPLAEAETTMLSQFDNVPVLHLLGANPSISRQLIYKLARHSSVEVRTGVAINPNAPLDLLISFRTPGKYTTLNNSLARNPRITKKMLREMYDNGEASLTSFGLNPNTPIKLMQKIAAEGKEIDRAWLATNPGLTEELILILEKDNSRIVRNYLQTNPAYKKLKSK